MGRSRFHPQGLLGLLVVFVVGCGLFEPREPRVAVPVPAPPCRAQSQPDSVIANIVVHYGLGTPCYEDQLADSLDATEPGFHFFADIQDYLARDTPGVPNPFDNWNLLVERTVTHSIATNVDTVLVFFDSEYAGRVTSTNPARETRYYNYRVLIPTPTDTTRYQGQAELTFIQVTSDWFLETFRDHRDGSGLPTWGSLRADNRR